MRMRHTVVISDIHFSETEPGCGRWMRYRQKAFSPEREIAGMIAALLDSVRGQELTLVLNGDVFDLDAPRVIGQKSRFHNLPRDADHALPALAAILRDCPLFIEALGRVLSEGHTLVIISGNHDIQLTLPEVRGLLAEHIVRAAIEILRKSGRATDRRLATDLFARVIFRAWFFIHRDGILIEHGHQYDPYCSYRHPMMPYGRIAREVQPTMGSLGARLLVARLGYINPHTDSSVLLSRFDCLAHWARYYLFSKISVLSIWLSGCTRILGCLLRQRHRSSFVRRRADVRACARETGASERTVARHARLFATPAEDTPWLVLRELWIDRVMLLSAGTVLGTVVSFLAWQRSFWGAGLGLLLLAVYERLFPKPPLSESWHRISLVARHLAEIHGARAVIFGHTHHAEGRWDSGIFFGNTGTWSAVFGGATCTELVTGDKPLVWLTAHGDGRLDGGLVAWVQGRFEPRSVKPELAAGVAPAHNQCGANHKMPRYRSSEP